jgi:hypothetical protein
MGRLSSITAFMLILVLTAIVSAQQQTPEVSGAYMGQDPPGEIPEYFAEGFVNTPMDMHGNIVFTPDLSEAVWHPDQPKGLYMSRLVNGEWTTPREISFVNELMHDAPCYSADGSRLYFSAAIIGISGMSENARFYFVDREGKGWSDAQLLDTIFDSFSIHWQFSVDSVGGLYFGGNPNGEKTHADIWFAQRESNHYTVPIKLQGTINTENGEFAPCLAPDGSYLIFNRAVFTLGKMPRISLYISFKSSDGHWGESRCLDGVLQSDGHDINGKISPDGKYLFFIRRLAEKSGTYWVSTSILEGLRPVKR